MKLSKKISILTVALMLASFIALPAMASHNQDGTNATSTQAQPSNPGTDGPANPFE